VIDQSDEGFEEYLKLLQETTDRQSFMAHTETYQRALWQMMKAAGIAYLARGVHEGDTLTAWMLFVFNGRLYYPYGASTRRKRNLMASSLVVWEAMKFGKKKGCKEFELWGCLGPNPDSKHSWYGLTRFKTGFGGMLVEYVGAHDLILNKPLYVGYQLADWLRWKVLKKK
jgi:lipid II:glycine glycyltransferase (peptidoglycan interpeptide bridge formation enzyme)